MTPKTSLAVAVLSIVIMLGTAAFAGNSLALVGIVGGFCAGMAVMSAAFHWPDQGGK